MAHREEEDDDSHTLITNGKRDFDTFNKANGDAAGITESIALLSTKPNGESSNSKINGAPKKLSYFELAASIPATRFEVFPPAPGTRKTAISRPSTSRPSSASRPRNSLSATTPSRPKARSRVSTGSSRRSSAARPSSGSRKKSGGTGRGPGRWPKGTTKKDFGDADSGPGLPPALVKQRSRLGNEVLLGDEEEEEEEIESNVEELEDDNPIVYNNPRSRRNRQSGRGVGLGKPPLDVKGKPLSKGKELLAEVSGDGTLSNGMSMEDEMDIDAEGEYE